MVTGAHEMVLLLLASAVAGVVLFRLLGLPPVLGYLIVGIAIGPHALGWVPSSEDAGKLAEFGIVFLMFSIGLEFSLPQLFRMRQVVFGLGFAQVMLTMLLVMVAALVTGFGWKTGLAIGGALAMSSTAIVVRIMMERRQLDTPHGREVVGVLLFQDLAVVPLLIVIPAIAGDAAELPYRLSMALLKAAAVLVILLFLGQKLMRGWFHVVARRRSRELFVLNVLLVTLGLAWLTELAGLSLALGAFLAGMLIAETEYKHQVEEDIKPFRDILLGLFFITVGMKLDLSVVGGHILLVLALTVLPVIFKFLLVAGLSRLFGSPPGTALRTGLSLAQAGEFGLVLLVLTQEVALLAPDLSQLVIAAMLLSMLATPFVLNSSDKLVLRWSKNEWMLKSLELHRVAVQSLAVEGHVLICGYGRTGQRLAHLLEQEGIRFIALDPDAERVRVAAAAGEPVVFGDAAHADTLAAAGVARASALVVTFADTVLALRILHHAHAINPLLPVIVRTTDDADMEQLLAAGATEVVPETFESSLMLASHALVMLGVPLKRVIRRIRDVRDDRYSLLRGFFHGESDRADSSEEARGPRLRSVVLSPGAFGIGKSPLGVRLAELGVSVAAVRRRELRLTQPSDDTLFLEGDVVVLLGTPEALERAELKLLTG
jgi:CPA2 family monovalent cation:H+ antiporter-2